MIRPTLLNTVCVLILLHLSFFAYTQNRSEYIANIRHLSTTDGLSHRDVYSIHQDRLGFIWMGTKYGLNRYDGHEFKHFTRHQHGLASNEINLILEDREGWLWVFQMENWENAYGVQHLSFVNTRSLSVHNFAEHFKKAPFHPTDIFSAIADGQGGIYLGLRNGDLVHYRGGQFVLRKNRDNRQLNLLLSQFIAPQTLLANFASKGQIIREAVLLDTFNHLQDYVHEGRFLELFKLTSKSDYVSAEEFENEQGVTEMKLSLPDQKAFSFTSDWLSRFYYDKKRQFFWYKSLNQLQVIHPQQGLVYDFMPINPEIAQNEIHCIYFARQVLTYIGTANGFYIVNLRESPFRRYLYLNPRENGLSDLYSCRQMTQQGDFLYVNTNKLRQKINLKTGASSPLPKQGADFKARNAIDHDFVLSVLPDQQGKLWFGERLLSHYNPVTGQEKIYDTQQFQHSNIWSIYRADSDHLWLGLENRGIRIFDLNQHEFLDFRVPNGLEALANSTVYQFLPLDSSHYLLASTSGLYLLHKRQGVVARYWPQGRDGHFFPSDNVFHIYRDTGNSLWIGTADMGLIKAKFNGKKIQIVQQFAITEGLASNTIYGVNADEYGYLWMPSDAGIIQFNMRTHFAKAYLPSDGVSYTEYNRQSHFKAADGTLYFGSINGVTAFHPRDFQNLRQHTAPLIQVVELRLLQQKAGVWEDQTEAFRRSSHIVLPPGKQALSLKFSLGDYLQSDKNRFAYRIQQESEQWNYLDKNLLQIWRLPYGRCTLEIRGQGADGLFSAQTLKIPIRVMAPFYLRWWFLSLLGVLALLAVWVYLKVKTYNLAQRNRRLEEDVLVRLHDFMQHSRERTAVQAPIIQSDSNSWEAEWLQELNNTINANIRNFGYSIEQLAEQMNLSRQLLNKRIKTLTGLTAVQYLQEARLNTAQELLSSRKVNSVKQAALEVGFKDVKYFSQLYKTRFGKLPSETQ